MQIGQSRRVAALGLLCLALALALALGLTGCDGSAKPKHTFTPTSTFSDPRGTGSPAPGTPSVATTGPNVRPGERVPVLPPGARLKGASGALQFATYWMEAVDWGYATTDSTLAKSLYAPECTDCARLMHNYDDPLAKGQHFRGGRVHVDETSVVNDDTRHPGTKPIEVTIHAEALQTIDAEGHVVATGPAIPKYVFRIWLKWTGTAWIVIDSKHVVQK